MSTQKLTVPKWGSLIGHTFFKNVFSVLIIQQTQHRNIRGRHQDPGCNQRENEDQIKCFLRNGSFPSQEKWVTVSIEIQADEKIQMDYFILF